MKTLPAIALFAVLTLSACATDQVSSSVEPVVETETTPKANEVTGDEVTGEVTDEAVKDTTDESSTTASSAALAEPAYLAYSDSLYNDLLGKEPFAIFFHASWCSTCAVVENDINANLSSFPKGSKILKADFDTERELKRQYGITVQSNIVMVDRNGNYVSTLPAPSSKQLKSAFNSLL